ncbi:MAG: sigma 54-interacting transcriptional regulator [Spirochaetales bacterium]|nr:sigma 54-interacting transcriptional regulator [Spirochaetales bacterium]
MTSYEESLTLIGKLSQIILEEKNLFHSLHEALGQLAGSLGLKRSMLTIYNRKTGKIYIKEAVGYTYREKGKGIYSPGEGITGRVVERGEPIIVEDITDDPRFLNRTGVSEMEEETLSFVCVPIKSGENIIGTLSAQMPRAEVEELKKVQHLLSIAGTIIFHAVLRTQAEEEEKHELEDENRRLQEVLGERKRDRSDMVGNSKVMQRLMQLLSKVAATDATVLIEGESGVGKSLVAWELHRNSHRNEGPFIKLNCAALPESIIESELFGHERGAFTGALQQRKGRFELANGGTIFLDEIGEISLATQAKLLRVLQEGEFERVGGVETLVTDARIIAATNRNLEEQVRKGAFREDLFYRLNIIPVMVPPLRDRKNDIVLLADHFIEKANRMNQKQVNRISTPAIDMLMSYHWPGNIRELEHAIERAVILTDDNTIHGYHLPPSLQVPSATPQRFEEEGTLQQRLEAIEYEMIVDALKATHGNASKAAEVLGLTNRMMGLRLSKYGVDYRSFRHPSKSEEESALPAV